MRGSPVGMPRGIRLVGVLAAVTAAAVLAGCGPAGGGATPSPNGTTRPTPSPVETEMIDPTASPSPTATDETSAPLPSDCRAILDDAVLAQLSAFPLNDPAFGPTGVQADGSLVCAWGDPAADTTGLTTTIERVSRGPALDMLNQLADADGFTCYTPDRGTRCERTWVNETYFVTDGRTLFWRADVMIDTRYSNLAPEGYTDAIIAAVFG